VRRERASSLIALPRNWALRRPCCSRSTSVPNVDRSPRLAARKAMSALDMPIQSIAHAPASPISRRESAPTSARLESSPWP
jgi:hypothetical protein